MRGRKPVPTVLRKLHGNPRKTAFPKGEPMPVGDLSLPPTWLTEEQKETWRYAISNAPPGLLKRIDASALTAWVIAVDLHRQAAQAQATVGLLMRVRTKATIGRDDHGVPLASPYISIISQQAKIMLKAASELGFTPVSRPRIVANPPALALAHEQEARSDAAKQRAPLSLEEFIASAPKRQILN